MLSSEEIERYTRHIVLSGFGGPAQQKLKQSKVLVIGAGGLGSPLLIYLAAAGVGQITIMDSDKVALSNLQRQIIHSTDSVGQSKIASAENTLNKLNPLVDYITIKKQYNAENALEITSTHDIVVEGVDNFATRYLANDVCYLTNKPLISGAVGQFEGYVTSFKSYEKNEKDVFNPNYRCLFPQAPPNEMAPACEEVGILGVVTGVVGTLMATEVIKILTDIGEPLVGRLLSYNALDMKFHEMKYHWDPENPLTGLDPQITKIESNRPEYQ